MRARLGVALLVLGYVAVFILLQPRIGDGIIALTVVPIIAMGWLFGIRGGLLGAAALVAINVALMQTVGGADGFRLSQIPRSLIAIAIGGGTGWIRGVTLRLRTLLEENTRVGDALRASKEGLELQVEARTAELVRANEELRIENAARREAEATIIRDMEARRELEGRAAAADRMAMIGRLAAGIGHEINNPLAAISANLSYIADSLSTTDAAVIDAMTDARSAVFRASEIVRNMTVFIQSSVDAQTADLRTVVSSALSVAANELRHRARLDIQIDDVPPIAMSTAHLGQVLLNLVINASQALPERQRQNNTIKIAGSHDPATSTVRIEIADTGSGIPDDVKPRIFDPFFTTKPVGVGSGLGLWICHRLVTTAGGTITVDSTPGQGTTFRIELPAAAPPAAEASTTKPPPLGHRRAQMLVIDDDNALRKAFSRYVRGKHDVVLADGAAHALEQIEAGKRFDVILCDVMMPGMTGIEFFTELGRVAPELKTRVVFMTGGTFTEESTDFIREPGRRLLEKPFSAENLETVIQQVLELGE